jgi:miniconductance mechanosensitive channel
VLDMNGLVAGLTGWIDQHPLLAAVAGAAVVAILAWLALAVVRRVVLRAIGAVVRRSPTAWDEILLDRAVFHRLSWALPVFVVYHGIPAVPNLPDALVLVAQRVAIASLAVVVVRTFAAFLAGVNEIYNRFPTARNRPIKGYLQVASVLAHAMGLIFIIATLMDRSPVLFMSGLGAMTAILMLIFRDTLLSLVAGVQLTSNDLIRVGDWIEMPQFGADGDVIDIALNSVTVQNWDCTFSVIPTHKFLEHSFKNWRGMQEAGGRRIKRALRIDMHSVRFLEPAEIERFGRFVLLQDYVRQKVAELEAYNREHCPDPAFTANARRLTNLGMLRAYMVAYLRQHSRIHQDMTFLVRQLDPGAEGLPLEIYVFTNDIAWASYEGIQADIFDHMLAMVPEFGLRVFQDPTGADMRVLAGRAGGPVPVRATDHGAPITAELAGRG